MKAIPENNGNAHWQSDLVSELAYIKQHLKYKPKLVRLLPAVFSGLFVILLIVTVSVAIYYQAGTGERRGPFSIIWAASMCMIFAASVVRYLQSLKFISIPSDYHLTENIVLVQSFLRSRRLAFSHHPQIPEVFQILSRNISAGKEDREVLLFIADDKRILINSHFTSGWNLFPRRRHHWEMAKMLKDYINNLDHSTGLMHQNF